MLPFFSPEVLPAWLNDYPVTIIQFLFFLYRNFTDFMQVFMSAEVLGALAGTLFPKPASSSQDSSGASTPADEVDYIIIHNNYNINYVDYILISLYQNYQNYISKLHNSIKRS